jgi:hypothetical protein
VSRVLVTLVGAMTPTDVTRTAARACDRQRAASTALLLVGYPVAVGAGAKLLPVLRERRTGRFLALEAGTACVTAGLILRRRWLPAAANGAALVGLALAWIAVGREVR